MSPLPPWLPAILSRVEPARRPLNVRQYGWPTYSARAIAAWGATPNQISILSVIFSAAGGAAIYWHNSNPFLLLPLAAVCIQLRLLCNLIDGIIAVEGGQRTKSGEVFNDMPDRFSDLFLLVPAGYALSDDWRGPFLGWLAGSSAVLTAYVRVLGGSLGLSQEFIGPMAKQHRMAIMTAACLACTLEAAVHPGRRALWAGLALIAAGSLWTTFRRARNIVHNLENR